MRILYSVRRRHDTTKGGNPLRDATAFDGFQKHMKCEFSKIEISIFEIRIQRCDHQTFSCQNSYSIQTHAIESFGGTVGTTLNT